MSLLDTEENMIENYEIVSNSICNYSPYNLISRQKGDGFFYWNTKEQLKYYKENGSPLEYVDEDFIE